MRNELVGRCEVVREVLRLNENRLFPSQPKPRQILVNRVNEFGPCASDIDVLDAHQEATAGALGFVVRNDSRQRMASVQQTIR